MADNKYFDGEINEYVDWITGYNKAEEINTTNQKSVSGGSIRLLIQNHLLKPFVLEYDSISGKNKLFSSAYAKDLYYSDVERYKNLLIGEFEAAAGYTIKLYKDNTYLSELGVSDLYIKLGDTTSSFNYFEKYFRVFKGEEVYTCNVYVQATIKNNKYKTSTIGNNFSDGSKILLNLGPYLHEGVNDIDITIGAFIGSLVFLRTFNYKIMVVSLLTSVLYNFHKSSGNISDSLTFDVNVTNSSSADITTVYKIDQNIERTKPSVQPSARYNEDISSLKEGLHTLLVMSYIGVTNNGEQNYLYSNIVYITFVRYSGQNTLNDIVYSISLEDRQSLLNYEEIPTLALTQYVNSELNWALVSSSTSVQKNITWKLQQLVNENWVDINVFEFENINKEVLNSLKFTPLVHGENFALVGYLDNLEKVRLNVNIKNAKYQVNETGNYNLKLENSSGYSNNNLANHKWISNFNGNEIACLFNRESINQDESPAFPWNSISGWFKNCMHISPGDYIYIPYRFFTHNITNAEETGATIEIEFEFKSITNPDDEIIVIGGESNKSKIVFTPNSATLYSDNNVYLVRTNFKANERIKLAFVINKNVASGDDTSLVMIVNNGILERVNKYSGSFTSARGIKIGKLNAGADIYIYKIRAWNMALTPEQLFSNYAIDSENTAEIISENSILNDDTGEIDYNATLNKIPVINITGRMNDLITSSGKNLNINVDLSKIDMSNSSKNMYIENCRIRKHGQSTLNYPIPSFKIWSNSTYVVYDPLSPDNNKTFKALMYGCNLDGNGNPSPNKDVEFYKGRYQMKEKSIPANKWVLQANYADSSGVHNGGIQRLITEAWFGARVEVNGLKYYKLRTPPQLIASIGSNREGLDENDLYVTQNDINAYNTWKNNPTTKKNCMYEYNSNGKVKLWSDCGLGDFPYDMIRVSPDSFPCALFYRETENDPSVFLGQYVFMDDKKSDYIYGERSIYKIPGDPFCLSGSNASNDTKENRLWNNDKCLRIEVVAINMDIVGYRSHTYNNLPFNLIVTIYEKDDDNNYIDKDGNIIPEEDLEIRGIVKSTSPNWYNGFELIYPDLDDATPEEINTVAQPFIDWHAWLVSTYEYFTSNGGTQAHLYSGSNYTPNHPGFNKFREEAREHLDLYKLAAYYIFFVRLGLVDSVERNALLKTYDGKHWHYEPWDMDIALGNQNTGGIKWNPPMTRATNDGSIAAFSGTHISNGTIDKSNWLWDALESWPEWLNIVRNVADALSSTLTYDKICLVLDEDYASKWCERMYNISGHFKYIETLGANMYNWLQGARTSHRHWWLKTSMDYYDARWVCGDFKNTGSYMNLKYNGNGLRDLKIKIIPSTKGYFCYANEVGGDAIIRQESLVEINAGETGYITVPKSSNLEAKAQFYIYGSNNIRELDISDIYNEPGSTGGILKLYLEQFADPVSGISLKVLNIGVPLELLRLGIVNVENISVNKGLSIIRNLEELNILGCINNGSSISGGNTIDYASFLDNTENLKRLYAIGTGLTSFTSNSYQESNEARTYRGGHYEVLLLPDTITALEFHDSSWEIYDPSVTTPENARGLSFWNYNKLTGTITLVLFENSNVTSLKFYGTTLSNYCAILLLKAFINKAIASGHPEEYTLYFEGINLNGAFYEEHSGFTFDYADIMNMSQLNGGENNGKDSGGNSIAYNYKGYIRLSNIGTLSELEVSEHIQAIQVAFGENVFTKTSYNNNLVVDFQVTNADDIFLTISSRFGDCYDSTNNTITEGWASAINANAVIVRASKFLLPDDTLNQTIKIVTENNVLTENYYGASVSNSGDLLLYVPEMTRDTKGYRPDSIKIRVIDNSGSVSVYKEKSIGIIHKVYPSEIEVDVTNSSGYHCFSERLDNTVVVNLNLSVGNVSLNFVYPAGIENSQKASINEIKFVGEDKNGFTITKIDDTHFTLNYGYGVSETPIEYSVNCLVVYKSGDTYDNFRIKFYVVEDDILVTSTSNPTLYNVLSALNINCMIDTLNNKLFTRSSLNSITSINFYDSDSTSELYTLYANLQSFLVDTLDATKGNLFDYISPNTLVININGCTNPALESSPTAIDLTRLTRLTTLLSTSNAAIKLSGVFIAATLNFIIDNISIYNADEVELSYLLGITNLDLRGVELADISILNQHLSSSNFNLVFNNTLNLVSKIILNPGNSMGGERMLNYLNDYIGNGTIPNNGIDINLTWQDIPTISISVISNIVRYAKIHHNTCILNGNIRLLYHSDNIKNTLTLYYPGLVMDWGELMVEIEPLDLEDYIKSKITHPTYNPQGVITPTTLARLNNLDSDHYRTAGLLEKITSEGMILASSIYNLLWFKYVGGDEMGQSKDYRNYTNLTYLSWPYDSSQDTEFKIGRYSYLVSKIIVTNHRRPPKNINGDSNHIRYQLIVIPKSYAVNLWYTKLSESASTTGIPAGLTTDADIINALAQKYIICQDLNGNNYQDSDLMGSPGISTNELDALLQHHNPNGVWYEISSKDADASMKISTQS